MLLAQDEIVSIKGSHLQIAKEFTQLTNGLVQSGVPKDTILKLVSIGCMSDEELEKELEKTRKESANE